MFTNKSYVLEVLKEKSFSKAAKNLYISQPSLSASIKRIEAKIGAPIFDRSTTPVSLTEIGQKYIDKALDIQKIEDEFTSYLNDELSIIKGDVKIGGSNLFSSYILPPMIAEFNKHYPATNFIMYEDKTQALVSRLADGEIDLFIDNVVETTENLTAHFYMTETILLAVPKSFRINERLTDFALSYEDIKQNLHAAPDFPSVSPALFKKEPFIFLKSANDTGKKARLLCKKYGITPRVIFETDQQVTAYNITSSGMGICFVSDTLIKKTRERIDVVYYKLGDPEAHRNICFYTKSNRYLSNACRKFIEMNTVGKDIN
ncbi:MAG: LysR family transcriptional regulator [Ruminococcaceae bacterium]|nr:LysR family transcriptional regulator [Oscillospiraceae bacterium]